MAALDRAVERASPEGAAPVAGAAAVPPGPCPVEGLRWSSDEQPGIRRERRGDQFSYVAADGSPVADEATLARYERSTAARPVRPLAVARPAPVCWR